MAVYNLPYSSTYVLLCYSKGPDMVSSTCMKFAGFFDGFCCIARLKKKVQQEVSHFELKVFLPGFCHFLILVL